MNRKIAFATIVVAAVMALLILRISNPQQDFSRKGVLGHFQKNEIQPEATTDAGQTPGNTSDLSAEDTSDELQENMRRYSIVAKDDGQFARLLAKLAEIGIPVDNVLQQIRAVSFTANENIIRDLRDEIGNIHWEVDSRVSRPEPGMTKAMKPFAGKLPEWLGMDRSRPERGQGVVIALIDEPVYVAESTAGANIRQLDLFGKYGSGSHGTAIASILLSDSNYLQGIVPSAELLSIPIVDSNGTGSIFDLAAAILAAVDNGAHIISISLCGDTRSAVLENAAGYAASKGTVIVAAAGNDGMDKKVYPASCGGVVSVSACDADGTATAFSNQSAFVDVCAPGVGIFVDDAPPEDESLGVFSGTSASAPCVAGVIACIMGENPGMTATEARDLVLGSASDNGKPGDDPVYGNGVLNYERASHWNDGSYSDAAAAGHYFDLKAEKDGLVPLVLAGQNTGNTVIGTMTLEYAVNGISGRKEYYDVKPGATVSISLEVPVEELDRVSVSTNVKTDIEEADTENNSREGIYSRKE